MQALLVALGMAALWGPLSATMHSGLDSAADGISLIDDPSATASERPVRLHVRWTRPPERLLVEIENDPWIDWQQEASANEVDAGGLTKLAQVLWDDEALDVWVEADWADETGREALEVRLEPEGLEERVLVLWGEPDAADGTTMSWRNRDR